MTKEEKIEDFFELREEKLSYNGEWVVPRVSVLTLSNVLMRLLIALSLLMVLGFFLNIYIPSDDLYYLFLFVVALFVLGRAGYYIFWIPFMNRKNDFDSLEPSGLFLSSKGLRCKTALDGDQIAEFADIKYIKIRRVGWLPLFSPKYWFVYRKDGEMMRIDPEYVTEGSDFVLFMRSTFPELISDEEEERMGKNSLVYNALNLFVFVLKSDHDGTEESREFVVKTLVDRFLCGGYRYRKNIESMMDKMLGSSQNPYRNYCNKIVESKRLNYGARYDLMDQLFRCAYISDGINESELKMLREIGKFLLLRDWHIVSLEYEYELGKKEEHVETGNFTHSFDACMEEAYKTLGVSKDAPLSEVKRVYEYMLKKFDPKYLPAETSMGDREVAKMRYRTIRETYTFLCANMKS